MFAHEFRPSPTMPPRPMIAAVVRTYTPAGSHTKSYYQVELIRPDGSIRVLTHFKENASEVSWVNHDELAFVVGKSLELLDVTTMKSNKISIKGDAAGFWLNTAITTIAQSPLYTDGDTDYKVDEGRLVAVGKEDSPFELQLRSPKNDWSLSIQPASQKFLFKVGSITTPIPNYAPDRLVTTFDASGKAYAVTANDNSTLGEVLTVFLVEPAKHQLREIVYGHRIALADANREWFYTTPRNLSDYGPNRSVWTSSLMECSITTGKKQTLISGLKSVQSFALRP